MSHRSSLIIALVLVFSFSARAQESATPLRGLDESAAAAVRAKAFDLLGTVAGQVSSLRSAENRARIGSNVAEALWSQDEKRARGLFAAVEEEIRIGLNDTDADESAHSHTMMVFWALRSDTIFRIAKHDPDLALAFLRTTRPPENVKMPDELVDGERLLELSLAGQVAAKNPQLALVLVRQSLAKGFSSELMTLFSQLKQKDKETSRTVYKEIVDKLKGTDLSQDWAGLELAVNLARSVQPPDVDEQVYRDLLGILLASAVSSGCGEAKENPPPICYIFGPVYSKIEKYYGSRAAPLKNLAQDEQGVDYALADDGAKFSEVMEQGTVDEIIALMPNYPGRQTQIYSRAFSKAADTGDLVRARRIASELPDETKRQEMLTQLDRYQDFAALNTEGKLALIQKELSTLRTNEERLQALLYMSAQPAGMDRKLTLRLLDQAGEIINSLKPGRVQLEGQIVLATTYCSLKSDRGFAIMEPLIPRLNELVAASATLDGIDNNYLSDGEWNMTGEGTIGGILTGLARKVGYFAVLDFDRSVTLASQLERPELRLMAELKIAQSVLSTQPLPSLTPSYPAY